MSSAFFQLQLFSTRLKNQKARLPLPRTMTKCSIFLLSLYMFIFFKINNCPDVFIYNLWEQFYQVGRNLWRWFLRHLHASRSHLTQNRILRHFERCTHVPVPGSSVGLCFWRGVRAFVQARWQNKIARASQWWLVRLPLVYVPECPMSPFPGIALKSRLLTFNVLNFGLQVGRYELITADV